MFILLKEYDENAYNELILITKALNITSENPTLDSIWWNKQISILIRYFDKNNNSKEILNKFFNKSYNWKKDEFINLMNQKTEIDSFAKLQFSFLYIKNFNFINIPEILKLHEKTEENLANSLYGMIDWIIKKDDDQTSRLKNYNLFIEYIEKKELKDISKINKRKESIKKFNIERVSNSIFNNVDFNVKNTELTHKDIWLIIKDVDHLKKYDERISKTLENTIEIRNNWTPDFLYLKLIKYEKLGKKTRDFLFKQICNDLKASDTDSYLHGAKLLTEYIKKLSTQKKNQILKLIKKRENIYKNLII